jgi:hypothetical protein
VKGGENVKKKIVVVALIVCFIAVGLVRADDKTPIPNTISSPELLGPHYLLSADPPKEDVTDETNIADLVKEGTITPGTEDRIKEVTDQNSR